MIHKHPGIRGAYGKTWKWNIEFFCTTGRIPAAWHYYKEMYPGYTIETYVDIQTKGYTIETYVDIQTKSNKKRKQRKIERLKEKGMKYYTQERIKIIASTGHVLAKG